MKSKVIPELGLTQQEVQSIMATLATGLVKDGHLSAEGKTHEQFVTELKNLLKTWALDLL